MRNAEGTRSRGQLGRCVSVKKLTRRAMQEVSERDNRRLCGLVRQRITRAKSRRAVVYEQCVLVAGYGSAGLGFGNDVARRHLFPKCARSLTILALMGFLLHLRNLTRRARRMLGKMRHEVMQRTGIRTPRLEMRIQARRKKIRERYGLGLRRRHVISTYASASGGGTPRITGEETSGKTHTRASGPGGSPDTRVPGVVDVAGRAGNRACTYGTF